MNTETMNIAASVLCIGTTLSIGPNIVLAVTPSSDSNLNGSQNTYPLATEQDVQMTYRYIDLQTGEVVRWKCENINGRHVNKYVELPTGQILHWNCGE